ncbi:MAG: SIMPL domain-containing protein [Poseidonibacter sp.]
MKTKFIFLIALLLPISLLSYEISFNKKFIKSVAPDVLSTNVNISIDNESEKFISTHIEKFNKYIKSNETIQKNHGNITISPKYKYFKNTQKFIGYHGNLNYTVKSKTANALNAFIDDLIVLESKYDRDNVKLRVSNLSWAISNKLFDDSLDILRIDAIKWIDSYSSSLKNLLSKDCSVKSININQSNPQFLRASSIQNSSSKRISNVAPISTNQEIKIEPNFILECK